MHTQHHHPPTVTGKRHKRHRKYVIGLFNPKLIEVPLVFISLLKASEDVINKTLRQEVEVSF